MTDPARPIRVAIIGTGSIADAAHIPALHALASKSTNSQSLDGQVPASQALTAQPQTAHPLIPPPQTIAAAVDIAAPGETAAADTPTPLQIVAAVDLDLPRAHAFAARWHIPAAFDHVQRMLAETTPDLAIICTPPGAHSEAVIACLDAGTWVWCEKPPALSLAEYDAIAAHEREGGPYAAYVFQHRFGSSALALREHIRTRRLGAPLVGICHTLWYRDETYYQVPWRGRWDTEGGGPTMGHGIHQMDLMLTLMGDWTEVRAASATLARPVQTEDVSMAIVRFASGAMVSMVNSVLSPRETSYLRFDFPEATVELTHLYGYDNANWTWTPASHRAADTPADLGAPEDNSASSHHAQLERLITDLQHGRRPEASGDDGRRVLAFIAALYKSAATGRPVTPDMIGPDDPFYYSMSGKPVPTTNTERGAAHV